MIRLHKNGLVKKVSTGYSWKSLFFGCLYPAYRGDFKGFFIQWFVAGLTLGLNWFFTPFVYNKIYIRRLIEKGYQPADNKTKEYLRLKFNYDRE